MIEILSGISLRFGVAGKHCQETGQIYWFMVQPNGPTFKVAGTEGKVGGCFCRLPALNENTDCVMILLVVRRRVIIMITTETDNDKRLT